MIIDTVVGMIHNKLRKIYRSSMTKPEVINLSIYIGVDTWYDMMCELNGPLSSVAYDISQNNGVRIMGHPIYRVLSDRHGIKVFED